MRRIRDVDIHHGHVRSALVAELRGYPTFAGCSADDVGELVAAAGEFRLPAEWSLLQEGIPADAFYVIREGTARVFDGRTQIATLGPGDVVGEMAFLDGGRRHATVSSATRLAGLRVDYDTLGDVIARRPRLGEALQAVYESRVA
ncbi:MAG: cyclic nucleotide-binding domain-containing protein [Actinomycetota bacterium]|nr:cyclic nucleotide-binding domain-containing protein [Actinomycetota bacterium]